MVMRREQVLKICMNFYLTKEVEFKPKDDNSWTFGASDFSEGEIEVTSFAIRFKNAEIANAFKKAIDDSLDGKLSSLADSPATDVADDKSKLIAKLQLPANFFDYLNAKDCPGCIGCKSDDYVFKSNRASNVKDDPHPLPVDQPKLTIKTTFKIQGQEKHVSFKIENANSFTGIKKSDGTMNIFAKFNEENPAAATSPSIFGSMNSFAAPQKPSGGSIFSSSLNTTPTSTEATVTLSSSENGIFGAKSSFTFGNSTAINGSVFGTPSKTDSQPTFGLSFGNSTQSADISSTTFSFADAAKELDKSREESLKSEKSPNTSIFGAAAKSFSFADAAKELDQTKDASFSDQSSNITFGSTVKSFGSINASKESEKSPTDKVPDFIINSNDMGGFAALATNEEKPTWATTAETKGAPPGGFFGLTVTSDIFSRADPNSAQNDDAPLDDNYDPHYDPIISLPDEIKVSTGEEEETKIFSDRAKLFRFDTKLKEWKERGEN